VEVLATQRKALALLAIVAASGPRGIARDRLMALLWPESDANRARGALKQMLHTIRQQIGAPDVIVGVADLRLEPSRLTSDVEDFRAALADGDDLTVVELSAGGPFLEGVFVEGSADFDHWVDSERARLSRQRGEALERLAIDADREGRRADAVRWWRECQAADPLNARISTRLMQALDAAGDRAGALQHARTHEALLRSELDAPPDAAVVQLAGALRARGGLPAQAGSPIPSQQSPLSQTLAPLPESRIPTHDLRHSTRAKRLTAVAVGVLALVAITLVFRGRSPALPAVPLVPNRVAVAVFVNRTGSSAFDALGTMASDWVTRGLARTSAAEVFDIGGLYLAGRAPDGVPTDPRTLARGNGAGLVVAGNYYKVADSLMFSVQVLDVASGRVLRTLEPIAADAGAPLAGVEEVRQRVASALGTILDPRTAFMSAPAMIPPRYEAYAEFAAGQEVYWNGDWERSLPHFRRAATLDTSFSAALAFLGIVGVGVGQCDLADSVMSVLAARRPQVTDVEWLSAQISAARCASDHETHNRLWRDRVALQPGSRQSLFIMSTGFKQLNRPAEALALLSEINPARDLGWLPIRGRAFYWREVAANHHLLGDYKAEASTADSMRSLGATALATAFVRGRSLAALGHGDSVLSILRGVADAPRDPAVVSGVSGRLSPVELATPGWVMLQTALELAAHGDSVSAARAAAQAVAWFAAAPGADTAMLGQRLTWARALEFLGRHAESLAILETLARSVSENVDVRGSLGVLAARMGDRTRARDTETWLRTRPPAFPIGLPLLYRAQIAAVLGDTTRALSMLRQLPHEAHPLDILHFHADPALKSLRATATMQRWLVPRG
jgi:DNA-binding SARP family transcriptional activator/TolB-like protein